MVRPRRPIGGRGVGRKGEEKTKGISMTMTENINGISCNSDILCLPSCGCVGGKEFVQQEETLWFPNESTLDWN